MMRLAVALLASTALAVTPVWATTIGNGGQTANQIGSGPNQAAPGDTVFVANVKSSAFGAKGDGATNDTAAFLAALATGNKVVVPPGTYAVCGLTIPANAEMEGMGEFVSILKATPACNKDVATFANAYTWFGTNTSNGTNGVGISNLTIDGNKSAQTATGSAIDAVNGLAIYGAAWRLNNVLITNVLGHGIRSEWYQFGQPPGGMEASLRNVTIDTVGRDGWWFKGPHDSDTSDMIVIDASQEADNTYYGLYQDNYGSGRFNNLHVWHRSTATNRAKYAVSSGGGSQFVNSHFEGTRGWFEHRGSSDLVTNSMFYASNGYANTAMVVYLGNNNIETGNQYSQPNGNQYAIQLGDGTHAVSGNLISGDYFSGFSALTPFNFNNDNGYNKITAAGYGTAGGATAYGGTKATTTTVDYRQGGTAIPIAGGYSLLTPDGTSVGGNAPGSGAVDIQLLRLDPTHSATGQNSFAAGYDNLVSGYGSASIGFQNQATTFGSFAMGTNVRAFGPYSNMSGRLSYDRFRAGFWGYAPGDIAVLGDAQTGTQLMYGSGTLSTSTTVSVRVTSNGAAAGTTNVDNILAGLHYHLMVSGSCNDTSSASNIWADWDPAGASLDRKGSTMTYTGAFTTATAVTRSAGAFSGATLTLSADGTPNFGLNATFTLPVAAATDTVHCVATADSVQEVQ